uniref:Retinal cone rhodopsin-sensitive cGMP 3',5'-cyclic phosphodiesterase subunit gamma n=1 Tax=Capra hircus TaxID=9925 RepID=A0A8C2N8A6_CAPHI
MSDNTVLAPPTSNQGPTTPRKGPPKFKQRQTRQFKSKPPKKGVKGFGDDIPGMEGLGTGPLKPGKHLAAVRHKTRCSFP